jgi:hypothetical protein
MPPEPLCLLMDEYGTHATPEMKAQAEALGIHLIFIPKWTIGK